MTCATENRLDSNARDVRWSAGLSREALAARAGTALETIRRLELRLPVGVKIETLMRISEALKVAPSDLLPTLGHRCDSAALPPPRRAVSEPLWKRSRNTRPT